MKSVTRRGVISEYVNIDKVIRDGPCILKNDDVASEKKALSVVRTFAFCCGVIEKHHISVPAHLLFGLFWNISRGSNLHEQVLSHPIFKEFCSANLDFICEFYKVAESVGRGAGYTEAMGGEPVFSSLSVYTNIERERIKAGEVSKVARYVTSMYIDNTMVHESLMGMSLFDIASELLFTRDAKCVMVNTNAQSTHYTLERTYKMVFGDFSSGREWTVIPFDTNGCIVYTTEKMMDALNVGNVCNLVTSSCSMRSNTFLCSPLLAHKFLHGSDLVKWIVLKSVMRWITKSSSVTKNIPKFDSASFELCKNLGRLLDIFGDSPFEVAASARRSLKSENILFGSDSKPVALKSKGRDGAYMIQAIRSFVQTKSSHNVHEFVVKECIDYLKGVEKNASDVLEQFLVSSQPFEGDTPQTRVYTSEYDTEESSTSTPPIHMLMFAIAIDRNAPMELRRNIARTTCLASNAKLPAACKSRIWIHGGHAAEVHKEYGSLVRVQQSQSDRETRDIGEKLLALFQMLELMSFDSLDAATVESSRIRQTPDAFELPIDPTSIDLSLPLTEFPMCTFRKGELIYNNDIWVHHDVVYSKGDYGTVDDQKSIWMSWLCRTKYKSYWSRQ